MNKQMLSLLLILILSCNLLSQELNPKDSTLYDFWIGEWELTWDDGEGKTGTGANHIYRILEDNVIYENFSASSGKLHGFIGKSYSVWNRYSGEWKQTWVDNQGSYLDFTGSIDGNNIIFRREFCDK